MGHLAWNSWDSIARGHVCLDCLMPTGILIPLQIHYDATLQEVKMELWTRARHQPLFAKLWDKNRYIFSCINQQFETEMLVDESRRLCDIRPFICVLKVVMIMEAKTEQILNGRISGLIGKGLHEFDALENEEVNECRKHLRDFCCAMSNKQLPLLDILWRQGAPDIVNDRPPINRLIKIEVIFGSKLETAASVPVEIEAKNVPSKLIRSALTCYRLRTGENWNIQLNSAILKICGREEYLLKDYQLWEYKYIYDLVKNKELPKVVMSSIEACIESNTLNEQDPYELDKPVTVPEPDYTLTEGDYHSVWDFTDKFHFTVLSINNLNVQETAENKQVQVVAGLYHGPESLCEHVYTKEVYVHENAAHINEELFFDIELHNLARVTKLCLGVYEIDHSKEKKRRKDANPLAWVNTTLFDFKGRLLSGTLVRKMWRYPEDMGNQEYLLPLETVMINTQSEEVAEIRLKFFNYTNDSKDIVFPNEDVKVLTEEAPVGAISKRMLLPLETVCSYSPLVQLDLQERELLWNLRNQCKLKMPHALPRLLQCVRWNVRSDISQMMALLKTWRLLGPEEALQLLDCAYADLKVRKFSVQCLRTLSDTQLKHYFLQLVQALKHECYLENDLVYFLLVRALSNIKIGHYFFWLLRSEMHDPKVSLRFGLLLEAYCRGNIKHMRGLTKQLDALKKLESISMELKKEENKHKVQECIKNRMGEKSVKESLSNLVSPLVPAHRLGELVADQCKVFDSKMRPFKAVFRNQDVHGKDVVIIFKNGDDLRQDMLTLQLINLMDQMWKSEDLDLKMIPYGCLTTGRNVGVIQLVPEANTIANIQKEFGRGVQLLSAFSYYALFKWLKQHNPSDVDLDQAIYNFTRSCAGYCVATYVLGIGDRHSDNIMLKKNGQLFHIDFGHILGNFKYFMSIKRERVPFVLTHDFVYVITKGKTKMSEFDNFQQICEKAFLILRKHSSLLISLFAMMLSTGLPELRSVDDLNYLQEVLCLEATEEEALKRFQGKFREALANSWKTSVNWALHNKAKNNKTD